MSQNNFNKALEIIRYTKEKKLNFLDLSGLGLKILPEDISDMTYLLDLNLSYNYLTEYPKDIKELYNLNYLNLSNNNLHDFELVLGRYYSYKEINISYNLINHIPHDFDFLQKDVKIIFNNNPFLKGLPPEIEFHEDLSFINFYVQSLNQRDNRTKLFETKLLLVGKGDVGKTTLMKVLENNDLDIEIGKENTTHGINISTFKKEVIFPAEKPYYNKHDDFENLIFLDEVLNYNESQHHSSNYNREDVEYEILEDVYESFPEELLELRISTEPRYIRPDAFFKKDVKINAWDFGGQEILYSTHQFFLTQRSIYIFVWEPRSDTEEENFDYWLNTIKRAGKNSAVIVVMNKSDIIIKNIDEESYFKKFENVHSFIKVSCYTKEGIKDLEGIIKDCISKLPHIADVLPKTWNNIRAKLIDVKEDYISYDYFKSICGFNDSKKERYLSGYLNDLGDIIHFKDDIRLNNLIVLNPHWLTKAIYELINSLVIQKNKGLFSSKDLKIYLNEEKYPIEKHNEILSLMEKFEICFKIIGSDNFFIIPTLLQVSPNSNLEIADFENINSLKLEISYTYMPSGIIERLICRLNSYIEGYNYWKFGVVFNTEINRGLVVSNRVDRKIRVFIVGEARANLYNMIFFELDKIHKDLKLKDDDISEMLACNCNKCSTSESPYMIDRKILLKFLSKNKKTISCLKSTDEVEIEEILIGYKTKSTNKSLVRDFINAFSQLQTKKITLQKLNEDERNSYLNDLLNPHLKSKNFYSFEQSRRGISESEKNQGELDIVVDDWVNGKPISFFEGFNLKSLSKTVIDKHLKKTLLNYDSNGLKEKFIGIYCEAKDFLGLSHKYLEYLDSISFEGIKIIDSNDKSDIYLNASEMKVFKTTYFRNDNQLYLYHILVNLK
ncbi:COR domain-containing protein [Olleya sp. R77988]|uniref:COR domain-containing protein n=1 Tax=Olleya sp. R77988 TaxID=3093875 RepID=UPI0037C8C094